VDNLTANILKVSFSTLKTEAGVISTGSETTSCLATRESIEALSNDTVSESDFVTLKEELGDETDNLRRLIFNVTATAGSR